MSLFIKGALFSGEKSCEVIKDGRSQHDEVHVGGTDDQQPLQTPSN